MTFLFVLFDYVLNISDTSLHDDVNRFVKFCFRVVRVLLLLF